MKTSLISNARRPSSQFVSTFWQLLLAFLLAFIPLSAQADLQDDLKRIGERFEKGEITERQALAQLAVIEKLALEQRKNRETATAAEEAAGSMILRRATLPRFSVIGTVLPYVLPLLALAVMMGLVAFFYGSSFSLNRIADWLARLRNHTPRVPPVPPARTGPARPSRPAGPSMPTGTRHSGEVPDHLT